MVSAGIFAQQTPKKDSIKTKTIEGVTMTKKVFEKKSDRFVYDVANSPVAKGNTAFGLLKETPLVSTTDDKTLKILGKSNAIIYINGRKTNMNADAVIDFLKGTSADNIQKIEVITVPGSEYQVESSDGIINIVLKKKMTDGLNGNFRVSNQQDQFNVQRASASINFRKNKLGISASISGSDQTRGQGYVLKNGNTIENNTSVGELEDPNLNLGGYINIDYELTKNQNLGFSWNNWNNKSYNSIGSFFNTINSRDTNNQLVTFYNITNNKEDARSYNNSLNLNYEVKTDSLGSKLNANVAYLNYKRYQRNNNKTFASDQNGNTLGIISAINQETPQLIDNYAATLDYFKKFKKDFNVSMGGNFAKTNTDNDSYFEKLVNGNFVVDNGQTNHFVYDEKISGVYLTLEKVFSPKFSGKVGSRVEFTNSEGKVLNTGQVIDRSDTNLLPYLSFSYDISKDHNLSYAFSSRVRRPSFWEINPVKIQLTNYNYTQNNPFMKQSAIFNNELTYMFKQNYFFIVSHSLSKDDFSQVPLQRVVNGIPEIRYIRTNFSDKQELSANLGMQKTFFKGIWTTNTNVGVQMNKIKGYLDHDPLDPNATGFTPFSMNNESYTPFIQTNNTLRLSTKKDWFLGANFFWYGSQLLNIGTLKPLSSLDVNIKKLWNDWTFTLEAEDILATNVVKIDDVRDRNILYVENNGYNRSVNFSIAYSFGNKKLQKMRNLDSANKDAKSRTR